MRSAYVSSNLDTGWYFPESLSTATVSDRPRRAVPTLDEYLKLVNDGIAKANYVANSPGQDSDTQPLDIVDHPIRWTKPIVPGVADPDILTP